MFVILVARRSCRYAGTRFLKRGANFEASFYLFFHYYIHNSGVSTKQD